MTGERYSSRAVRLSRTTRPTRTDLLARDPLARRAEGRARARHAGDRSSSPGTAARRASVLAALSIAACGGCPPSVPSELRVEGPVPFVRCLAFDPPDARSIRAGSHAFEIDDRVIRAEGFGQAIDVAIFAGPGAGELDGALFEHLSEDVVIVLGGFGRTRERAKAFFDALAARDALVLLVAGGDDDADVYRSALDELDDGPIVDATALDRIDFGFASIAFVAGAPQGRYARTPSSCGFTEADLDALAGRLEALDAPLWIAAWAAPVGAAGSIEGAEAGDPMIRAFMTRAGARGGLFAWPELDAGRIHGAPDRVEMVVPSVSNLALERADGTRASAAITRVTVSARGLVVVSNSP